MSESTTPESTPAGMSRRSFLSTAWLVLSALATGEAAYLGLRYIGSRKVTSPFGQVIEAGSVADFPPGTITLFSEARFFLVRFDDGGVLALHNRCTHLACVVSWDERRHEFRCPCHGSAFDQHGSVLNPPAPRSLYHFPIELDGDTVKVDTGRRLEQRDDALDGLVYMPEAAG